MKDLKRVGFTLVELLVVVAITSTLLAMIFVSMRDVRINSRNSQRIQAMDSLQKALALYQTTVRRYPGTVGTNGPATTLLTELVSSGYITAIQNDPLGVAWSEYYYCPGDDLIGPQAYVLRAKLEQQGGADPPILGSDIDGTVFGCDCSDTSQYYCLGQ